MLISCAYRTMLLSKLPMPPDCFAGVYPEEPYMFPPTQSNLCYRARYECFIASVDIKGGVEVMLLHSNMGQAPLSRIAPQMQAALEIERWGQIQPPPSPQGIRSISEILTSRIRAEPDCSCLSSDFVSTSIYDEALYHHLYHHMDVLMSHLRQMPYLSGISELDFRVIKSRGRCRIQCAINFDSEEVFSAYYDMIDFADDVVVTPHIVLTQQLATNYYY
jgi:hypothetical protein